MNILFVCNEYPPSVGGGIGPSVRVLARGLVRAGHNVHVAGLYASESRESDCGVVVHRFKFPFDKIIPRTLSARSYLHNKLINLCEDYGVELIEWPDFQGLYYKEIRGVRNVVKLHGTTLSHRVHGLIRVKRIPQFLWEREEIRALRSIKNWVGVSRWFLEEWKEYFSYKPLVEGVVYNPVDVQVFAPNFNRHDRENAVLYSGGFRRRKGIIELFNAANIIFNSGREFELRILGFEAEFTKQELLSLVPGHTDKVKFYPFSSQEFVAQQMSQCKAVAMPSFYESCGNGWIEAMACGTPVLGSKLSCGPEIVRDGIDGYLVDPNDIRSVSDGLDKLMFGPELCAEDISSNAIHRFSVDSAVAESMAIYQKLI